MYKNNSLWCLNPDENIPNEFISLVKTIINKQPNKQYQASDLQFLALLLWKRNIRTQKDLEEFFKPTYIPDSNSIFEKQINIVIERLIKASKEEEKVAIWGDYSCDSIITTAILYTGLRDIFSHENQQLSYYFPPRNLPKFGLNIQDIQTLKDEGSSLIICASIGSKNYQEIEFANNLGIDIIIIENTVLSIDKPPVLAWLNPSLLPDNHPDYYLSGGAIAYKLIKLFHNKINSQIKIKYEDLRCLVAVGLIADNYSLKGNNRYFAISGKNLLENSNYSPSLQFLITSCQENGDRTLNIDRGIGAIIKAICHTYNDVNFVIDFLTCHNYSLRTKIASFLNPVYYNYLHIKEEILNKAKKQIESKKLSSDSVLILQDNQWNIGILEPVSKFISNRYNLTTVLLSANLDNKLEHEKNIYYGFISSFSPFYLASIIQNYQQLFIDCIVSISGIKFLINQENIVLFKEAIEQQINKHINNIQGKKIIPIDLEVNVSQLNENLFEQLTEIEPCSSNNPPAKLLLKKCQLTFISYRKKKTIKNQTKNNSDSNNKEIYDSKLFLSIGDDSSCDNIDAIWWGISIENLEKEKDYDIVAELEKNPKTNKTYLKIIDIKPSDPINTYYLQNNSISIIDYRQENKEDKLNNIQGKIIDQCPIKWSEINSAYQEATISQDDLILRYKHRSETQLQELWYQFLGIIKQSIKENQVVNKDYLLKLLSIRDVSLEKICLCLPLIGIEYQNLAEEIKFNQTQPTFSEENYLQARQKFQDIIQQEYLQKEYFYQVKLEQIRDYLKFQNTL